jgi:hypothetical protein
MDGSIISVFFHSTDTTYNKKIKTQKTKNKVFKQQGAVGYLTPRRKIEGGDMRVREVKKMNKKY